MRWEQLNLIGPKLVFFWQILAILKKSSCSLFKLRYIVMVWNKMAPRRSPRELARPRGRATLDRLRYNFPNNITWRG